MPIRVGGYKFKVFVSSSIQEFEKERYLVGRVIDQLPYFSSVVLEDTGARPRSVEVESTDAAKESDVYLAILGSKYSETTTLEYRAALSERKPLFIYLKKSLRRDKRLQSFIEAEIKPLIKYKEFNNFKDLPDLVQEDLPEFLGEVLHDGMKAWLARQIKVPAPDFSIKEVVEPKQKARMTTEAVLDRLRLEISQIRIGNAPVWVILLQALCNSPRTQRELTGIATHSAVSTWLRLYEQMDRGRVVKRDVVGKIRFAITQEGILSLATWIESHGRATTKVRKYLRYLRGNGPLWKYFV